MQQKSAAPFQEQRFYLLHRSIRYQNRQLPADVYKRQVLDGASRVLEAAFPAMPRPARSAVGVTSLPGRAWAEVEIIALLGG